MTTYKDFLGINICIYDPILTDSGAIGSNNFGYIDGLFDYTNNAGVGNVSSLTEHNAPQTLVLLNLHRNGPFGYPMWKQTRVSQNHLSRAHRLTNTFTYVQEPGAKIGDKQARYGDVVTLTEPVIAQNLPISVIGEVSTYNDQLGVFGKKPVELKTAFNNEIEFFANKQANEYFNTILETDDNYEALIEMYLDGGLEDEGSLLDSFSLFTYRQTIWPKAQYAYLDDTRSRNYFVNTFWRSNRTDRTQFNVDNGFSVTVPSQSMWPLDAREDFTTRTQPTISTSHAFDDVVSEYDIGGNNSDNAESAPGILQNRYSSFTNGGRFFRSTGIPRLFNSISSFYPSTVSVDNLLTSSAVYSRLHTLKNYYSPINPSGPKLHTTQELKADFEDSSATANTDAAYFSNHTASIFNGTAFWDAPKQSGKEPFYDSYSLFSEETRRKGKGFTKIPEFRISNHVEFYLNNSLETELEDIFEISGALGQENATTSTNNFYKILSNSDFLKHFDLVKSDHKDLAEESIIKIKCKAIKKLLPYKGFYPADRCVQLSQQFYESYKDGINPPREGTVGDIDGVPLDDYDQFATKPVIEPLFSPGILFNTIKSGVAVDWPVIFGEDYVSDNFSFEADDENDAQSYTFSTRAYASERGVLSASATTKYQTKFNNALLSHSNNSNTVNNYQSMFTSRIPFEALVDPAPYLSNKSLVLQEPHPFALGETTIKTRWTGLGDPLYKKMMSNFLAEVPDFYLKDEGLRTISSLEEQSPEFGNAEAGNFYLMRVKMTKSRNKANQLIGGYNGIPVTPPQDVVDQSGTPGTFPGDGDDKFTVRETLTMYSRPTAFGPPVIGDGKYMPGGSNGGLEFHLGSSWGYNFPYTPPYYHGESWCDLIFYAEETKKYTLEQIMSQCREFPYYTRYWSPSHQDAMRDLTGYTGSTAKGIYSNYVSSSQQNPPWSRLIHEQSVKDPLSVEPKSETSNDNWLDASELYPTADPNTLKWTEPKTTSTVYPTLNAFLNQFNWYHNGPQSPIHVNNNAMQLSSSINIFGKGTVKTIRSKSNGQTTEVASGDTVRGKTRWIIQPKFETPILNFNRFDQLEEYLNESEQLVEGSREFLDPVRETCTAPKFGKSQVPRGMWHQYGDLPKENEGIYLQVSDVPDAWLRGALGIRRGSKKVKSLADLVGFSKEEVRLGEVANVKEISEAVVAVPFIEKDGTRKFFSIPRKDIDSCIGAVKREVEPNTFVAGGPPKAGDSVYQMVKNMQKYVFPPSMDFVRYKEIDPFAMYIFEFKHNLTKQDLSDIWQNLSPEIATSMSEAEASISHELLAHELLGGGAVVKNGVLDDNAEGNGIPSNIQWMVFKAKKRAKTNYFDKVVAKKGTTEDTSSQQLENAQGQTGDDLGVTYNWPYDFFSLVELVKIDAEISFANIENDDKGQKSIKKVESKKTRDPSMINKARGKGRAE